MYNFIHLGRGKKPPVLSEVVERAQKLIKRAKRSDDTQSSQSSTSTPSTSTVRSTRAPAIYRFYKDAVTGRRITHCQYRPRRSVKNGPELDDVDADDAGNYKLVYLYM